jgi:hypothetical protein
VTITKDDAAIFRRAADVIDRDGLHQGSYWADAEAFSLRRIESTACCVVGAIAVARGIRRFQDLSGGKMLSDPAVQAFARHLELDAPVDLFGWNDDPLRTKQIVVDTLREAADSARDGRQK